MFRSNVVFCFLVFVLFSMWHKIKHVRKEFLPSGKRPLRALCSLGTRKASRQEIGDEREVGFGV